MSKVRILSNVGFGQWWSEVVPWAEHREHNNMGGVPATPYGTALACRVHDITFFTLPP